MNEKYSFGQLSASFSGYENMQNSYILCSISRCGSTLDDESLKTEDRRAPIHLSNGVINIKVVNITNNFCAHHCVFYLRCNKEENTIQNTIEYCNI